jgi:hypothetical protein
MKAISIILGLAAAGAGTVASGQSPTPPAASAGDDREFLEAILGNATNPRAVRVGAAERLLREGSDRALGAIERSLASGDAALVGIVAEAIDRTDLLPPRLVGGLVATLAVLGDAEAASVGRVLAATDPTHQERIATLALDAAAAPAVRRGPIVALGEFHDRSAQGRLMTLLEVDRKEPPEVIAAAVLALSRSTGLGLGTEPGRWRDWWIGSRDGDASAEFAAVVRSLTARLDEAERSAADERRRSDRLSERLVGTMREWLATLPVRERFDRCASLLKDEWPPLRTLGLREAERLLRNGERPTDAVVAAARGLLDDPDPSLRSRGARLLRDLRIDDLDARLAERLAAERDATVVASWLAILEERPNPAAFAPALARIGDASLEEPAAALLCRLVERRMTPPEWEAAVRGPLRPVVARRARQHTAKLLALAGDESDLASVQLLLDATDPAVRTGAAEGLLVRGVRRPLLERADDPAIYPSVIAALAEGEATPVTLAALVAKPPPEASRAAWNAAIASLLRRLAIDDLLEADRLLEPLSAVDARTRIVGLERIALNARSALTPVEATDGLRRLVEVQLAAGRIGDAIAFLEGLKAVRGEPLHEALFRAEALAGNYADAAILEPDAGPWIALAEDLAARGLAVAGPLAEQALARFGSTLPAARREELERIRGRFLTDGTAGTATPRP